MKGPLARACLGLAWRRDLFRACVIALTISVTNTLHQQMRRWLRLLLFR